jgi:hypothetical protein
MFHFIYQGIVQTVRGGLGVSSQNLYDYPLDIHFFLMVHYIGEGFGEVKFAEKKTHL